MSLLDELKQLQELPPPGLPSLWPQTWGWWVLLALLVLLISTGLLLWQRHRRRNAYRRAALRELDSLMQGWRQQPTDYRLLREIPELLKRAALSRLSNSSAAVGALSGVKWQSLLERMARAPLPEDLWQNLAQLAYAQDHELHSMDIPGIAATCRHWLETHHDPA